MAGTSWVWFCLLLHVAVSSRVLLKLFAPGSEKVLAADPNVTPTVSLLINGPETSPVGTPVTFKVVIFAQGIFQAPTGQVSIKRNDDEKQTVGTCTIEFGFCDVTVNDLPEYHGGWFASYSGDTTFLPTDSEVIVHNIGDPCENNPCGGGTCTATDTGFTCHCADGFEFDQALRRCWFPQNPTTYEIQNSQTHEFLTQEHATEAARFKLASHMEPPSLSQQFKLTKVSEGDHYSLTCQNSDHEGRHYCLRHTLDDGLFSSDKCEDLFARFRIKKANLHEGSGNDFQIQLLTSEKCLGYTSNPDLDSLNYVDCEPIQAENVWAFIYKH